MIRISIPVDNSLLIEFRRVCSQSGRTYEDAIRQMIRDAVADSRSDNPPLPGMRIEFEGDE